jgi:large subunit ribosomal protein L23
MSLYLSLRPRLNEKTYALSARRVYVFNVEKGASKQAIASAVESQFEVKVESVRTLNAKGKEKRTVSLNGKRSVNATGKRNDVRKAYVTLQEGFALPFFDAVEEAEQKQEAVQAKVDKAAAKQSAKTDKPARRGLHLPGRKTETKKAEEK